MLWKEPADVLEVALEREFEGSEELGVEPSRRPEEVLLKLPKPMAGSDMEADVLGRTRLFGSEVVMVVGK